MKINYNIRKVDKKVTGIRQSYKIIILVVFGIFLFLNETLNFIFACK